VITAVDWIFIEGIFCCQRTTTHSENTSLINHVTGKEGSASQVMTEKFTEGSVYNHISAGQKYLPLESGHCFQEDC